MYPQMRGIYEDLHANPELGFRKRAPPPSWLPRCASWALKSPSIGKTGLVAIYRNGAGPTVMVRTELDAPPWEKTGLPYASKASEAQYSGRALSPIAAATIWP
jgi:hippurate hydrolase